MGEYKVALETSLSFNHSSGWDRNMILTANPTVHYITFPSYEIYEAYTSAFTREVKAKADKISALESENKKLRLALAAALRSER